MKTTERAGTDELIREHEVVKAVIRQLEMLVEESGFVQQEPEWDRRLYDELLSFRRHLQRHFYLEEEDGFMVDVVALMPQASDQVEELCRQHSEILSTVDELIRKCLHLASGTSIQLTEFRNRVLQVLSSLRDHETEENQLVQQVFHRSMESMD